MEVGTDNVEFDVAFQEALISLPFSESFRTLLCEVVSEYKRGASSIWSALPRLCYLAAGGKAPATTTPLVVAFSVATIAATLLDDIQDGDGEQPAGLLTPPQVINIGVALAFIAQNILNQVAEDAVRQSYTRTVLLMCDGQHRDISASHIPTLSEYSNMVAAKSASCFAWVCQAGAMLGNAQLSPTKLEGYARFGQALGHLHQLANDIIGLHQHNKADLAQRKASFPVVIAFESATGLTRETLEMVWSQVDRCEQAREQATQLIARLAGPHLVLMSETLYHQASEALKVTNGDVQALGCLETIASKLRLLPKLEKM